MTRKALRREALAARDRLPSQLRAALSAEICGHILRHTIWNQAQAVFVYVSFGSEVDTRPLLEAALFQGKQLLVPRCLAGGHMEAVTVEQLSMLEPGRYGILEPPAHAPVVSPQAIDLSLVPGLAFDPFGARVGYGGGYYDRFLAQCPALRVGLCFPQQRSLKQLPVMPWDQRVHALALPQGIEMIHQEVHTP